VLRARNHAIGYKEDRVKLTAHPSSSEGDATDRDAADRDNAD